MNSLKVEGSLYIRKAAFRAGFDLKHARIGGLFEMEGAFVAEKAEMDGLEVGQGLLMRDVTAYADVDLVSAKIGRVLSLNGSIVTGRLNMYGSRSAKSFHD